MENVPQVINKQNVDDFNKWQLRLEQFGYHNYHQLLNAKDYDIPQNRNRCFMVSILGDYSYSFPKKQKLKLILKDMLEDEVDEKYYLSKKQIQDVSKGICQTLSTMGGNNVGVVVLGNYSPSKHNASRVVDSEGLALTIMENHGTVTAILDKDNYIQWQEKGRLDIDCRAYKEDKIAPTTTTTPKTKIINNLRIRKLTPLECWRLMGVKDEDFEKVKVHQSESSLYHLAGDSIVVNVLMEIFKELL